jgi:MFS family permease
MDDKEWGSVADWVKAGIALVGLLGALASYGFLPEEFGWVWPVLALIGLGGVGLIIARLPSARRAARARRDAARQAHAEGDRSVAIAGDVKGNTIVTGNIKDKR